MVLKIGTAMGEWALVMLAAKLGVKMPTFMVVPINSVKNYLGVGRGTLIGTLSRQVKPAVKEFFSNKQTRLSKKVIPHQAPGWNKDLQKTLGNPEVASLVRQFTANKINRRVVYGSLFGIGIAPQIIEAIIDMRSDTSKPEVRRDPLITPWGFHMTSTFDKPAIPDEESMAEYLDQPRLLDADTTPREDVDTESVGIGELAKIIQQDKDRDSKPQYTRGEALRITNQMAQASATGRQYKGEFVTHQDWKKFHKEQQERGYLPDKEDPSLIEDIKKVAEYLTKDRPKRERDKKPNTRRRGSPLKKGGVVNKRVTKQYAKGGSVRTPKRIK